MPPSRVERAAARLLWETVVPPAAGEQRVCHQDGSHRRGGAAAVASGCAAGLGSGVWTGEHRGTQWPVGEVADGRASRHGCVDGRHRVSAGAVFDSRGCWQQQLRTCECIRHCWGSPLPPSVPLSRRAADRITGSAMPSTHSESSAHILKVLSTVDFYSECPRVLTFENICQAGLEARDCSLGGQKFSKVLNIVTLHN
jgi:hypothetical protein